VNILAVETALGACSAAVVSGDQVLAQEHEPMLRGHAESLAPMVQRIMLRAGMEFRALERIAVTTGPGTFTGQRVGLAFARALGVALKIPVAGITTLEVMTEEALTRLPAATWSIAAADAKRREIYLASTAAGGKFLIEPQLIALADLETVVSGIAIQYGFAPVLAGTAAGLAESVLTPVGYRPQDSGVRQPSAVFLAALAARTSDIKSAKPLYLRPPDAKPAGIPR
jgi:tRNA threonylcarbamoyladenosine biosynthesis protein TsaB